MAGEFTREQLDSLVLGALETTEGRVALAASMANPIRLSLDYQGIARKLLVVEPLAQGALPVFDKDFKLPAFIVSKRGQAPDCIAEGQRITVPLQEFVVYPQVRFSRAKEARYNIIDRAQQRAKIDLMAEEDRNVFNALITASTAINPTTAAGTALTRISMAAAYQEILKWDIPVAKYLMNASEYADILQWTPTDWDPVTQRVVLQTGIFGQVWGADILVSKMVPRGTVLALGEPELVGMMPIRQDVNVIPADNAPRLRLGWIVYEELGFMVTNPRAIAQISVTGKSSYIPW